MIYTTYSESDTVSLGFTFGKELPLNSVVCFFGDLAAGKTTFIKGVAAGAAGFSQEQVNSPTFVYLNIYEGKKTVYHFDLYRLRDADEFLSMGFDEMFTAGGICCIEWSERIASLLPADCIQVVMSHQGENKRRIEIRGLDS
jgi:tRNA threonylcarbamoyladenosine biosynthesis protein TsaE